MTLALPYFDFSTFASWTRARLFPVRRHTGTGKNVVTEKTVEPVAAPALQGQWQVLRYL